MSLFKLKKNNAIEKYNFTSYISKMLNIYIFNKPRPLVPSKNAKGVIIKKMLTSHKIAKYSYYFLKPKNVFNYKQYMFMIKSNNKQYFLSFLGYNVVHFKTVSTGKILAKKLLVTKALKSSKKADKYLLLFFNSYNSEQSAFISYYLLRPVNRKNLNFLYLILKTYKVISEFFGFYQYYNVTTKGVKRIKKRIKKKLLSNHTFYN